MGAEVPDSHGGSSLRGLRRDLREYAQGSHAGAEGGGGGGGVLTPFQQEFGDEQEPRGPCHFEQGLCSQIAQMLRPLHWHLAQDGLHSHAVRLWQSEFWVHHGGGAVAQDLQACQTFVG